MAGREQTIAEVFKRFGKHIDAEHHDKAYRKYKILCDHANYLAKRDFETHEYLKSYYEENGENYPACLSDDQKQACLPLYDFLCSAGTMLDLTNVWPTYVFLVEVYNKQNKSSKKSGPHIKQTDDFIPHILQNMKSCMDTETWNAAETEYFDLIQRQEQMKRDPDLAREKELWVLNGDVAAQKFLDNIEYMDRALYITIKEALQRNLEGSQATWCQYGSLLHSSELLRRSEEQKTRRHENEIDELREKFEELRMQNELKSQEIEELTTRLSQVASQKVATGNPNHTDLSDSNRPTKIGERFSELYDNEWTHLFESLQSEFEDEKERIIKLCNCVQMAYKFCKEKSAKQLEELQTWTIKIMSYCQNQKEVRLRITSISRITTYVGLSKSNVTTVYKILINRKISSKLYILLPQSILTLKSKLIGLLTSESKDIVEMKKDTLCHLLELRKQCCSMSLPNIHQMFKESFKFLETNDEAILKDIEAYLKACVEICWFLCIQDPPMVLIIPEKGETIDKKLFKMYKTSGDTVDICVWPALLLSEDGSVVCKGHVLPQK
ncbi:uncharacterized protein LOC133193105 [Saccostrea echinata]|uniref:uncharacterized protein LOC133193105 n=1 Tax=Saccostrea echinata TaxID=191078 RepID=UPI002A81A5ED|nr:uncharacterized protein LOC133193105 [Saccostrea echinata]